VARRRTTPVLTPPGLPSLDEVECLWDEYRAGLGGQRCTRAGKVSASTPRIPRELRALLKLVAKYVKGCSLPTYPDKGGRSLTYLEKFPPPEGTSKEGLSLTGQCDNAASMFKFLAGGVQLGWRTGRLSGDTWPALGEGSHFFVFWGKDPKSAKAIIDPTASQFPPSMHPIPYHNAKAQTSGGDRGSDPYGRRYPKKSSRGWQEGKGWMKDAGIRSVLKDPKGPAAIAQAIAWAEKMSGKKLPQPDQTRVKLPRGDFPGFEDIVANVRAAAEVTFDITPLAKEELETKLTVLGRRRRAPALAKEVLKALARGSDRITVSREAAEFIKEELEHSMKLLKDPSLASEPGFVYHRSAIEHSLRNLSPVLGSVRGPASLLRGWIADARADVLYGEAVDMNAVRSLVEAAGQVLLAKEGKCPSGGCVVKRDGKWRVVSNKTGELWPQTYDSEKKADIEVALQARIGPGSGTPKGTGLGTGVIDDAVDWFKERKERKAREKEAEESAERYFAPKPKPKRTEVEENIHNDREKRKAEDKNMKADAYRKKQGRCPDGFHFDGKKCVKANLKKQG